MEPVNCQINLEFLSSWIRYYLRFLKIRLTFPTNSSKVLNIVPYIWATSHHSLEIISDASFLRKTTWSKMPFWMELEHIEHSLEVSILNKLKNCLKTLKRKLISGKSKNISWIKMINHRCYMSKLSDLLINFNTNTKIFSKMLKIRSLLKKIWMRLELFTITRLQNKQKIRGLSIS